MITQEFKELLSCNLETGIFIWSAPASRRVKIGQVAGCLNRYGYVVIRINRKLYKAHRLVWLYATGSFPTKHIDHINGIKSDNRLCNLREATQEENQYNSGKHSNNTSGFKGVCWDKATNKWKAQCRSIGKVNNLGLFSTPVQASEAYQAFAKQHHKEFYKI